MFGFAVYGVRFRGLGVLRLGSGSGFIGFRV